MSMTQALIGEIDQEAMATRAMLERVPADKLDWKPHEKSMSLGQLALHVAGTVGQVAEMLEQDAIDAPEFSDPPAPGSKDEILAAFDESIANAKATLSGFDESRYMDTFRVMAGDQEVMAMPKAGLARAIMLSHWYHHRGQLSVYLRMLDVPLPVVYGATADENPFAELTAQA